MFNSQICYTEVTSLLQFTINVHKSHRQTQHTSQLLFEDRVLLVSVDLQDYLRWQQCPKCERAARHVYPRSLLYTSLYIQTNEQKSWAVWSGDSNSCIWVTIQNQTQVRINFTLSHWPILPPKILTFPSETPCIPIYITTILKSLTFPP